MKKKKKLKFGSLLSIIYILASFYFMFSIFKFTGVETFIRYFIIIFLLVLDILIILKIVSLKKLNSQRKRKKQKVNVKSIIYNSVLIFLTITYIFLGFNLNNIYSYFTKLNKNITYSTSLVTLVETEDIDFIALKGAKIGILSDTTSQDGYILAKEIIKNENLDKNNELVSFDSYQEMITALYEKRVDYIFLPTNYADIFSTTEGFEDVGTRLKTITTTEKEASKEDAELLGNAKDVSEPFTILLIGIDSTVDGLKQADSFNGDSLMLITFNPKTMNATMLSIPRDSYVPIACFNGKYENKITHSAARGTSCVINTIEDFLDVEIDYYMKINFTGVVDLVDALGGVEVDVPYSFCEQNSKREFGNNMVYVKKGYQTLNGEQALVFSRNRKTNAQYCSKEWTQGTRDDFVRANNQQTVVQAILDKMKGFTSIDRLKAVLEVISNNLDTNMSEETILSFYNIAKDVMISSSNDEVITIQKLFIAGYGQYIYDETTKLQLWNYVPNVRSVNDVKNAMKVNLGLKKHEMITTFEYSINDGYEKSVIGKGPYSVYTTYDLLIDLTKKSLPDAEKWAKENGIKLNIEYVEDSSKKNDTIIEQSYPVNKRLDKISDKTVTIKVVKNKNVEPEKVDCLEDEENEVCVVPNFVSKNKSSVNTWGNKFSNKVTLHFLYVESDEAEGTIIKQSVKEGTLVKKLVEDEITLEITIAKKKNDSNESSEGNNENVDSDKENSSDNEENKNEDNKEDINEEKNDE